MLRHFHSIFYTISYYYFGSWEIGFVSVDVSTYRRFDVRHRHRVMSVVLASWQFSLVPI